MPESDSAAAQLQLSAGSPAYLYLFTLRLSLEFGWGFLMVRYGCMFENTTNPIFAKVLLMQSIRSEIKEHKPLRPLRIPKLGQL